MVPHLAEDLVVTLPDDRPGMLAKAIGCVSAAGINIDGYSEMNGVVHVLTTDLTTARRCLIDAGFHVVQQQHVALVQRTAEATSPDVELEVKQQYTNMRRHLDAFPEVVEAAAEAIRAEGLEVLRVPIRGETDGSILSERGLPTPNLFTGGHEYHSKREWASLQDMASAAAVVVRLAEAWAV